VLTGNIANYCTSPYGCFSSTPIKNLAVRVTCMDYDDGDCFIDMKLHTSYGGHADNKFNLRWFQDGWAYYAVRGNSIAWWTFNSYAPSSCVLGFFCSAAGFGYQTYVKYVYKQYL
jgi:hypothetical protein